MDARANVRTVVEFLWVLRRSGLSISPAESISTLRALSVIPWTRETVRSTFVTVLAHSVQDASNIEVAFDAFFGGRAPPRDLFERLAIRGATEAEIAYLREYLSEASMQWVSGGASFDHALSVALGSPNLAALTSPLQVGFYAQKIMSLVGRDASDRELALLAPALRDAFGEERGSFLAQLLRAETERTGELVRNSLEAIVAPKAGEGEGALVTPFAELDPEEHAQARLAVRSFAKRLGGGARTRRQRHARGSLDMRSTMQRAFRTGGAPLELRYRRRNKPKPKLWVLCDVSDSVRAAASFMLEFGYVAQDLFAKTRTFVFVSDVAEATHLFRGTNPNDAISKAASLVRTTHNSNYGAVFRAFLERFGKELDRSVTLVILGDARNNYLAPDASALSALSRRAKQIVWLVPEAPSRWGQGDSAIAVYRPYVTRFLPAATASDLERAARLLVRRSR